MACINVVMVNNGAVTNQLVAATGIGKTNHVKLGKGIIGSSATFWTTTKRNIKMKVYNNDEEPNGDLLGNSGNFDGKLRLDSGILDIVAKQDAELDFLLTHHKFQEEVVKEMRDFVGREREVYYAERLTKQYRIEEGRGPEIYIKRDREVINPFRDHKIISNIIIKVMAAKRMGKSVIVATGGGQGQQYGIITAAACDRHGLDCTIFMGSEDNNKQSLNVQLITSLGAQVKWVEGNLKEAVLEARKEWIRRLETSLLVEVKDEEPNQFQESKKQGMDNLGSTADVLILGCIESTASNVLGLFLDHFIQNDKDVRLILVHPDNGIMHSAAQIMLPHSIGEGLESPREEGLKLSFLKEIGKVEFYTVTNMEVMEARNLYFKLEGIFPSKEASYACAYLHKLCPTLPDGCKVVVHAVANRGDKNVKIVFH